MYTLYAKSYYYTKNYYYLNISIYLTQYYTHVTFSKL